MQSVIYFFTEVLKAKIRRNNRFFCEKYYDSKGSGTASVPATMALVLVMVAGAGVAGGVADVAAASPADVADVAAASPADDGSVVRRANDGGVYWSPSPGPVATDGYMMVEHDGGSDGAPGDGGSVPLMMLVVLLVLMLVLIPTLFLVLLLLKLMLVLIWRWT